MTSSNTDSSAATHSDQAAAPITAPSSARFNSALAGILLALAAGVAVSGWLQLDGQKNLFARLEQQYRSDVGSLRAELDGISIAVNQQAALLQRTVGTVLPFKIPEETEHELLRIENELTDEEELSAAQVEILDRAFESAITSLPSWAQSELLPRTLPLRWQLESHKLLAHFIDEPDLADFQAYQEELSAYAEGRPSGAPEKLADTLQLRASGAEMIVEYLLDQRLAAEREQQFRQNLEMRIEAIEAEIELYETLEDAALKARLASSTHAAIEDLQIALATTELDIGELWKRASTIAAQSAQHLEIARSESSRLQQELQRKYQLWALERINSIPALEQLEKSRLDKITSGSAPASSGNGFLDRGKESAKWAVNKAKETAHRTLPTQRHNQAIQAAENELVSLMITRLGNIDVRLLDEAVGEWYRRTFSDRFASLKPEAQEEVVAGFARTIKRSPEELASSGELP